MAHHLEKEDRFGGLTVEVMERQDRKQFRVKYCIAAFRDADCQHVPEKNVLVLATGDKQQMLQTLRWLPQHLRQQVSEWADQSHAHEGILRDYVGLERSTACFEVVNVTPMNQ